MLNQQELSTMTAQVLIKSGTYRNRTVENQVFPLIKDYQQGARGGFVTVDGSTVFGAEFSRVRVRVDSMADLEFVGERGAAASTTVAVSVPTETDQQVMARISERFEILRDMSRAAISGDVRAMIVSGPPGVGKSYGVEQEIERASLFDRLGNRRIRHEIVKGSITAIGLYQLLYKFSDPGCVLVFDDADSIFFEDTSLNLLKGALDSGKKRRISWLGESNSLRREGIPDSFDFKGSVIFITNINLNTVKSQKLRDHISALQSRCHYLDLTLNTQRDKLLRIRQIVDSGELFADYDLDTDVQSAVVQFVSDNVGRLQELSLRTVLKIADLAKSFPDRWQRMAETTVCRA
jgi:hypothetical protein